MGAGYVSLADVGKQVQPIEGGIVSRTLHNDDRLKAVIFAFGADQELSEHTASTFAVMHFLSGEADITLGDDKLKVGPGAWIHMQPGLRHSIRAKTPVVMLLSLLKG